MGKRSNKTRFEEFKKFRAQNLVAAAEEAVPNLRERSEIFLIGGPLTHERYLSRAKGSYGPGWIAGAGFPSAKGPRGLPETCSASAISHSLESGFRPWRPAGRSRRRASLELGSTGGC